VVSPVSKNEMANAHYQDGMPQDFRYEPQTSAHGNLLGSVGSDPGNYCGSDEDVNSEGLWLWQQWYDSAGVPVETLQPGEDITMSATITADHGGQVWMMISCADKIRDQNNWVYLERAASDRDHHFMPSNPTIYAWAPNEIKLDHGKTLISKWTVPADFTCEENVVGRWLWKTANTCNDANNIARPTEIFRLDEFAAVVHAWSVDRWIQPECAPNQAPETFISCFDFRLPNSPVPRGHPEPIPQAPSPPAPQNPGAGKCMVIDDRVDQAYCDNVCGPEENEISCAEFCFCEPATLVV